MMFITPVEQIGTMLFFMNTSQHLVFYICFQFLTVNIVGFHYAIVSQNCKGHHGCNLPFVGDNLEQFQARKEHLP